MKIIRPLLGKLNQGVIFSCARAERYDKCPTYGLVITARCDIAQNKFPVLNYLPVVSLDDWLARDGFEILLARADSDIESKIHSSLENISISKSILNSQSPRQILEAIYQSENADKKIRNAEPKFAELVVKHETISRIIDPEKEDVCSFYEQHSPLARTMLKELAQNRLTGYYFLQSISDDGEGTGFVALMREVSRLPRELARRIAAGLEPTDKCFTTNHAWSTYVSFEHEPFAMPIGEIPSPAIEHLLQSFSTLFGRIGLDDIEASYLAKIVERRPTVKSGETQ